MTICPSIPLAKRNILGIPFDLIDYDAALEREIPVSCSNAHAGVWHKATAVAFSALLLDFDMSLGNELT